MQTDNSIEECLAYAVLRDPDSWIGSPSTEYLNVFLVGAEIRAALMQPSLPSWRIHGVLDEPEFYERYVAATGNPQLSIRWATALAMTHFSLAEGFEKLRDEAIDWHRIQGVKDLRAVIELKVSGESLQEKADNLWGQFARCPGMFLGNTQGWSLYCFLNGMDRGGDWLNLPEMPRLREVFDAITTSSEKSYGSKFAAFRVYDAPGLLEWTKLRPPSNET